MLAPVLTPRRVAFAVSIGAFVCGCGLSIVGLAANETPEPAEAQAEATTPDVSAPDVVVDEAAAPDAGAIVDAHEDAPSTYCTTLSPAATFCADFDDPADADVAAGWDPTALDAGASVTASTTTVKSGIRSLHAVSTQNQAAILLKTLTVTTDLSVDFDVRYVSLPAGGTAVWSPLLVTPPTFPGSDLYFFGSSEKSYFQEFGDAYSQMLAAPSLNVWHHVSLSLSLTSQATVADGSFDGTAYWTHQTLPDKWPTPTTATIEIGVASLYQTPNGEAFIDNVVMRAK